MTDDTSTLYRRITGYQQMMTLYQRRLQRWSTPYQTQIVRTRHGDTYLFVVGDRSKPPLIILHGYGDHAPSVGVEFNLQRLSQHFCVYIPDVIGQAGKSAVTRPLYVGTGYGEWLLDICQEMNITAPYIVAKGGGALIALKYQTLGAATAQKICLLSPSGLIEMGTLQLYWQSFYHGLFFRKKSIRSYYESLFTNTSRPLLNYIIDDLVDLHTIKQQYYKFEKHRLTPLTSIELRQIGGSVYILVGDQDISQNIGLMLRRAQKYITGMSYHIVEGANQELVLTHQDIVTSDILDFGLD